MKGEFSILLAADAWSQLGRVDATAYSEISRALGRLAEELQPGVPAGSHTVHVLSFTVNYEVDPAGRRLIVHSVLPS